ncbi:MAG: DEAD/DEAH box helicase family protein [Pseudomonadota bacterium]
MNEIAISQNWTDFKNNISNLKTKEKGDAFELLVKYYLLIEHRYSSLLKNVWLLNEVPISVHKKLNLPNPDEGIDLIAEAKDGKFWAIQAKYRDKESSSLTHTEIATFSSLSFVICKNISFGLVCTTTERYAKLFQNQDKIGFCSAEIWRKLDEDFFNRVKSLLKNQPIKLKPFIAKKHQLKAITKADKYFIKDGQSRGKLIMPCGSGKTLAAYWISKRIQARKIIIAVPSLSLLSQTIDVWLRENTAVKREMNWIAICSDATVANIERDELSLFTQDLGIPVETDVETIKQWLNSNRQNDIIVFTTYQSGKVIAEASEMSNTKYDFGIFDEAHKTVGRKDKLFSYLLHDENITISKRLFMTATERRYVGNSENIISMHDYHIFGDTIELLSFKEALEYDPPILSDYKILTIVVDELEIERLIRSNKYVYSDKIEIDKEMEAEMLASVIALRKAQNKYPIKHMVSFHRTIKRSQIFKKIQDSFSVSFPEYGELETFHINGKMSSGKRDSILNEFSLSNLSLISNARCLTEGVDVKNIDCILFADPKKSVVDIVQAVGRALRTTKNKEYGYIVIPIINRGDELEVTAFDDILFILKALASNDERIIEYFRTVSNNKRNANGNLVEFDFSENIARKIDIEAFIKSIETKCWKSIAKLSWRPFEEAREFARSLNLSSVTQWREYYKAGKKPDDIPVTPDITYKDKGWNGYGDWLGTGNIANFLRGYRSFKEAREFARSLNLKSGTEWKEFCNSGKKPSDIPVKVYRTYQNKGWKGWGDFLGTGRKATQDMEFLPFEEAREFARSLNLKNAAQWKEYCKSGKKPDDIPAGPSNTYKDKGWKGWGDFLGTNTIAPRLMVFRDFNEARKFIRSLELKSERQWKEYCKSGNKPVDIPFKPYKTYKDKDWKSMGDWLGTGTIAPQLMVFRDFNEAREFVHSLKLNGQKQWREYCKSGNKPDDIPAAPDRIYKDKGWKSMGDWLGTGKIAPIERESRPFTEARQFAHSLNLKSRKQWEEFCKSVNKPDDIPAIASRTYRKKGWKGWGDFLGTNTIAPRLMVYRDFEEAKKFARSLNLSSGRQWSEFCKNGNKPDDIPVKPDRTYKEKGWKNWGDWLGTGNIANYLKEYRPFREAREFARSLNLKSGTEWKKYCKIGIMTDDIPTNPNIAYKNIGWKGMGDWLGTGTIASQLMVYKPFKEAREFVHSLNLNSGRQWREYCKNGNKPNDIPAMPNNTYKNNGWKGMGDWLGTGNIAPRLMVHRDFEEAKKFVHSLNIKSQKQWKDYCKKDNKPNDIPTNPNRTYKGRNDNLKLTPCDNPILTPLKLNLKYLFALYRFSTEWEGLEEA